MNGGGYRMESMDHAKRHPLIVLAATAASGAALAGCGASADDYANAPRPPAPIIVTASISHGQVSVSPRRFGAGPISLVITNQTRSSQQVVVDRDEVGEKPFSQQTAPIDPRNTAALKADLTQGTYRVHVQGDGIRSAHLAVGPQRPSAQNDLLQP
jgi:hypothetical protein